VSAQTILFKFDDDRSDNADRATGSGKHMLQGQIDPDDSKFHFLEVGNGKRGREK